MKFRWGDYLNVALVVAADADPSGPKPVCVPLAQENEEARYRIAISRAYYAALGVCREHIKAIDSSYSLSRTGEEHNEIRHFFLGNADPNTKKIGRSLGKLKDARRNADYELALTLDWKKEAEKAFGYSNVICNQLG